MATLDYVEIPPYATRLQEKSPTTRLLKAEPKIVTSLPQPTPDSSIHAAQLSPNKLMLSDLPTMLLSSTLQLPSTPVANPRGGGITLMSTRDPLSIPITTVNFKRFTSKIGPVYWLQDRLEEIIMWKKGWKVTGVWMAAYAFLCCFPRLVLLLPHIILIGILLATNPSRRNSSMGNANTKTSIPPLQVGEGSVDWQANLQATQNLLGAISDLHDAIMPILPHLTYSSPYTPILLSFTLASLVALMPLVYFLPLRPTFLVIGLSPFFFTHPFIRSKLLPFLRNLVVQPCRKALVLKLTRLIDDDNLKDKHWRAEIREVELWENERWNPNPKDKVVSSQGATDGVEGGSTSAILSPGGWGKNKLKPGERKAWTRGRDGFSGIADNGSGDVSSNLTFSLQSGWSFIETEDWRPDLEGSWIPAIGADDNGWVYTNDAWLDPRPLPSDEWVSPGPDRGMTRRRRWIRRIYYAGFRDRTPSSSSV